MEQYEKLWQDNFPNNQMVADWDTFIDHFGRVVLVNASIPLSDIQKDYIAGLVDPKKTKQVYKNAYLLFIKNFWSVPSNRTRFLSMKLNLTGIVSKRGQQPESQDSIVVQIEWRQGSGQPMTQKYSITSTEIKRHSSTLNSEKQKEKKLKTPCFISFGAQEHNEIIVDSNYSNPSHFKIIYKQLPKRQKKSFFAKKTLTETSPWLIRDVSRSSRLRQWIKNIQQQYVVLKKGMVFQMGLTKQYIMYIKSVQQPHNEAIANLDINLNSQKVDLLTGKAKPKKDIINYDLSELTPEQIIAYFDEELYYPKQQKVTKDQKSMSQKDSDNFLPIQITLVHKSTSKVSQFSSKNKQSFTIGRNKTCDLVIEQICIRDLECLVEIINGVWVLRSQGIYLYLVNKRQMETNRISNRQKIIKGKEQIYEGEDFRVKIQISQNKQTDSEYD